MSKPNEHMEQDFADTYGEYLKEDGTKDAKAVMRMVANLLEAGLLPAKSKAGQLGTRPSAWRIPGSGTPCFV